MNKFVKYTAIGISLIAASVIIYNKVYVPKHTFKQTMPEQGNLKISLKGIGNINAEKVYNITPWTPGKILSLDIKNGQQVKKGQRLFTIDPVDLQSQIESATLTIKKSDYDLNSLRAELKNIASQQELALKTYKRTKILNLKKFTSTAELDTATSKLNSLNFQVGSLKSKINSLKVSKEISFTNLEKLMTRLKNLTVKSPVNGFITDLLLEEGQSIMQTSIVMKIVKSSDVWVETKFDERISGNIKVGQTAQLSLRSNPNKIYSGYVKDIERTSDLITLERKINVAFNETPNDFFINEQVEVIIDIKTLKNVIKIPAKYIAMKNKKTGVWTNNHKKAKFNEIDIIGQNNDFVATEDINITDKIILKGKNKISEGMRVYK